MSSSQILPIIMFCALPGAGKSETRRYLKSLNAEQTKKFHLGDTSTQIDDFPYVDIMKKISIIAKKIYTNEILFFEDTILKDYDNLYDYGTLAYLIDEDYFDVIGCNSTIPKSYLEDPSEWLFNRIDVASVKTGKIPSRIMNLKLKYGEEKYNNFKRECKDICLKLLKEKYENIPKSIEGKTIVFEFSRGKAKGDECPLKPPYGYSYTLSLFNKEILNKAAIMYIWVTPEQSLMNNIKRHQEALEGKGQTKSTQLSLNHEVKNVILDGFYHGDDIHYLIEKSNNKNYLPIIKDDIEYHIKCGIFDNREDLTTDFRKPENEWTKEQIKKMDKAMIKVFENLLN